MADYVECIDAGGCPPPVDPPTFCNWREDRLDHPVTCLDWAAATGYCAWKGRRLCTEAEWEKAARGTDGRIYPWGNESPTCALAVARVRGDDCERQMRTLPVGSRPAGASPYGALDMAGNVQEWVADRYSAEQYETGDDTNPAGPVEGDQRVLRGGSWYKDDSGLPAFVRDWLFEDLSGDDVGFRCCQ